MNKTFKIVLPIVFIIIIALGATTWWLYKQPLTSAKQRVFTAINLPAALVNRTFIGSKTVFERYKIAEEAALKEGTPLDPQARAILLDNLVSEAQVSAVADRVQVTVSQDQLEAYFKDVVAQAGQGDDAKVLQAISDRYHTDAEGFKQTVLLPELLKTELQIWYNNQKDLQSEQFAKIDEIKTKLDQNEGFATLAGVYSESDATKDIGGDVGIVAVTDAVPEMQTVLKDVIEGAVVVAHSRYGHHVVKVESVDTTDPENKKMHVREIFLSSTGFDDWFNGQLDQFTTKRFLKL